MPFCGEPGNRIYWKLEGLDDAPALVLLNSIGTDMDLWDPVLPMLRKSYRLLRLDARGHGASDAPDHDYTMSGLATDVFRVMDAAGLAAAAVAGVSLGGMIAMEMALMYPDRVAALALVCTSATMDTAAWSDRVAKVRSEGMGAIADLAMGRFLSPEFIVAEPVVAQTIRRQLVNMAVSGYAGCAAAIRDMDLAERIDAIRCQALIVTGAHDVSTPLEGHGDHLLKALDGARHCDLPVGHLAPLEAPEMLADCILSFLRIRKNS